MNFFQQDQNSSNIFILSKIILGFIPFIFVLCNISLLKVSGLHRTKTDSSKDFDGLGLAINSKFHNEKNDVRFPLAISLLHKDLWNPGQNTLAKFNSKPQDKKQKSYAQFIVDEIDFAVDQYKLMGNLLGTIPGTFPKTTDKTGNLVTCNSSWWTTGFFPSSLSLLYGETHDNSIKIQAEGFLSELEVRRKKAEQGYSDNSSWARVKEQQLLMDLKDK